METPTQRSSGNEVLERLNEHALQGTGPASTDTGKAPSRTESSPPAYRQPSARRPRPGETARKRTCATAQWIRRPHEDQPLHEDNPQGAPATARSNESAILATGVGTSQRRTSKLSQLPWLQTQSEAAGRESHGNASDCPTLSVTLPLSSATFSLPSPVFSSLLLSLESSV